MAQTHAFRKAKSLFSTTLSAGISTGTGETITPASVTGLPTDTEITLTIDRVDSTGTATPTKMERITGVISAGNLTAYTRGVDGSTEQSHSSGAVVEYIWNADDLNDLVDGILVGHNQDGTHDPAILYDTNGNEELKFTATASAVNEFTIVNAATGNFPTIQATGEADTGIDFENSEGEEILKLDAIASAVNELTIKNAATGSPPSINASGGDDNISILLEAKGTGLLKFPITREGGSATDWKEAGTTTYNESSGFIQCGAVTTSNSAVVTVTFPVAFTETPIVIGSILNASTFATFHVESVGTTSVNISAFDAGGSRVTTVGMWIAIGK